VNRNKFNRKTSTFDSASGDQLTFFSNLCISWQKNCKLRL